MSMTFTKLFASITESTIWCEPDPVRLTWITMMAMADKRGRVWGTVPGLANRARVEVEACRTAIDKFLSPDPDSRTPDHEGRRIERIEGGWRLLNYVKYREIRDEEERKAYKAAHEARRRAAAKASPGVDSNVDNVDKNGHNADAEADALNPPLSPPTGGAVEMTLAEVNALRAKLGDRTKLAELPPKTPVTRGTERPAAAQKRPPRRRKAPSEG